MRPDRYPWHPAQRQVRAWWGPYDIDGLEAIQKILPDKSAGLLGFFVVCVVVACGQGVRADQNTALDLVAEPFFAGARVQIMQIRRVSTAMTVAHAVVAVGEYLLAPQQAGNAVGELDLAADARLDVGELETIQRWVEAGAPEGDPAAAPPPPSWPLPPPAGCRSAMLPSSAPPALRLPLQGPFSSAAPCGAADAPACWCCCWQASSASVPP